MYAFFLLLLLLLPATPVLAQSLPLDQSDPARTSIGALEFKGAVVIPSGTGKIGGLSALVPLASGQWLALSDTSRLFALTLQWDERGHLTGVSAQARGLVPDTDGQAPTSRARWDAEALVRLQDRWLVSYERDHRLLQFPAGALPTGTAQSVALPPQWLALPRNEGVEALAAWPDGQILAIAEAIGAQNIHLAWLWQNSNARGRNSGWLALTYRAAAGFKPTDAAVLPNGDLLVLERNLSLFHGWRSRVVHVARSAVIASATLTGKELAVFAAPILTENFEALAVQPLTDGRVRLLLLSDNNFNAAQQTLLAAFEYETAP